MKEQKKSNNKTKAAIILLIVMVVILLSNFYRLQNSKMTNENINAVFNDRLVVANYIYQYANDLHSIKGTIIQNEISDLQKQARIEAYVKHIQSIDKLYLATVLTAKEKTSFVDFVSSCSAIEIQSQNNKWSQVIQSSDKALKTLNLLSQIQINEGKAKLESSNLIHMENTAWGELQIALLIVLGGVALYLLIVEERKIKVKIPQAPSMN